MTNSFHGEAPLGLALYESMQLGYSSMDRDQQNDLWFVCTTQTSLLTAHAAIQKWLRADEALLNRVMEQPGHMVTTVFAPILVWALNQEWAGLVSIHDALSNWQQRVQEQSEEAQRLLTASFCNLLVETLAHIPAKHMNNVCVQAFRMVEQVSPAFLSASSGDNANALAASLDLAIAQGHLAARSDESHGMAPLSLKATWQKRWSWIIKGLTPAQTSHHLCALLDSNLPSGMKTLGMSAALGNHWCAPDVQLRLRPLLPFDEFERAKQLPWAPKNSIFFPSDTPLELAARNEALLQTYCPKLHATLCSLVAPSDWLSPESMRSWIQTCAPASQASLPLPADLDASPSL